MRLTLSLFGTVCFILLVSLVIGNLGGCQARYRYPCQDPVNWNKEECHNDICKVEGDCTSHTLGELYKREDSETEVDTGESPIQPSETEKTNSHSENHISSTSHQSEVQHTEEITSTIEHEPIVEGEQPLTMDTVVDTSGHNLAAR